MAEIISYMDSVDAEALGMDPHEFVRRKKSGSDGLADLLSLTWPGKVRREKEKTAFVVQTLDDDIKKSAVRPRFKQFWGVVYDRWKVFEESANLPLAAMVDQAIEYRRKAYDWRTALETELKAAALPLPKTPPPGSSPLHPDKPPSKQDYVKGALIVAGIAGGIWGFAKIVRAFKGSE